jgi:hypothetical protein
VDVSLASSSPKTDVETTKGTKFHERHGFSPPPKAFMLDVFGMAAGNRRHFFANDLNLQSIDNQ